MAVELPGDMMLELDLAHNWIYLDLPDVRKALPIIEPLEVGKAAMASRASPRMGSTPSRLPALSSQRYLAANKHSATPNRKSKELEVNIAKHLNVIVLPKHGPL